MLDAAGSRAVAQFGDVPGSQLSQKEAETRLSRCRVYFARPSHTLSVRGIEVSQASKTGGQPLGQPYKSRVAVTDISSDQGFE